MLVGLLSGIYGCTGGCDCKLEDDFGAGEEKVVAWWMKLVAAKRVLLGSYYHSCGKIMRK